MSRIGKLPIKVPDKVNVTISSTNITVKGPKGELSKNLPSSIKIIQNDKSIPIVWNLPKLSQ
jgi:large subunit ribosomal protein L6